MGKKWIKEEYGSSRKTETIFLAIGRAVMVIAMLWLLYSRWGIFAQAAGEDACIRHVHVGSQDTCGACYGEAVYCEGSVETYFVTQQCGGALLQKPYLSEDGTRVVFQCATCGTYTWGYQPEYYSMWTNLTRCLNTTNVQRYRCGLCRTECSSPESSCSRVDHYAPNCGLQEGQVLAELVCTKSTDEWTRQLTLEGQLKGLQTGFDCHPEWIRWNGEEESGETLTVTANGTYTAIYPSGEGHSGAQITVCIDTIDREEPLIAGITKRASGGGIAVSVQCSDESSGIGDSGFSWDNGVSWCGEDTREYRENGTYQVMVRDRAGNVARMEFTISGIVQQTEPKQPADSSSGNSGTSSSQGNGGGPDSGNKMQSQDTADTKTGVADRDNGGQGQEWEQNTSTQSRKTQQKTSVADDGAIRIYSVRAGAGESGMETDGEDMPAEEIGSGSILTEQSPEQWGQENTTDAEGKGQEILFDSMVATTGTLESEEDLNENGTSGNLLFFLTVSLLGAGFILLIWYLIRRYTSDNTGRKRGKQEKRLFAARR